jgi:hypothetical protein
LSFGPGTGVSIAGGAVCRKVAGPLDGVALDAGTGRETVAAQPPHLRRRGDIGGCGPARATCIRGAVLTIQTVADFVKANYRPDTPEIRPTLRT